MAEEKARGMENERSDTHSARMDEFQTRASASAQGTSLIKEDLALQKAATSKESSTKKRGVRKDGSAGSYAEDAPGSTITAGSSPASKVKKALFPSDNGSGMSFKKERNAAPLTSSRVQIQRADGEINDTPDKKVRLMKKGSGIMITGKINLSFTLYKYFDVLQE
jgi:hypothetical protein